MNVPDRTFEIEIAGVGPASVVLEAIFSLCERLNKTNPSPGLLLDEFITVWNELKRWEVEDNRDTPSDIMIAFSDALGAFFTAIQPYGNEPDGESMHSRMDLMHACEDGHVALNKLRCRLGRSSEPVRVSELPVTTTSYCTPNTRAPRTTISYLTPVSQPSRALPSYSSPSATALLTSIQNNISQLKCFQPSVLLTHGHLEMIHRELKNREFDINHRPPGGAVDIFHQSLSVLWSVLAPFRSVAFVERELCYGRLSNTIRAVNIKIDGLSQSLVIATPHTMAQWSRQLDEDANAHRVYMNQLLQRSDELLNAMRSRKWQVDIMVLLAAELDKINHNESEQPEGVQRFIREIFQLVWATRLKTTVPVVPRWFVAEHDITYEPEPCGRGVFGSLHRGNYKGRDVIVQMLGKNGLSLSTTPGFEREIDLWLSFDSPYVVKLVAACYVSNRPFIVTQPTGTSNLADYLQRSVPSRRMWKYVYEAALGLSYLHSNHVAHGDVRLSNLLVDDDGHVRVSGFGFFDVKVAARSEVSEFASGTALESDLPWLAPECFMRKPDYAADVYSLGMTIVEAALGGIPYGHLQGDLVRRKTLNGELPQQPPRLSDDGWALVEQMTARDPADRLALQEVIAELELLAELESTMAS